MEDRRDPGAREGSVDAAPVQATYIITPKGVAALAAATPADVWGSRYPVPTK